jgi:hypothetical protein
VCEGAAGDPPRKLRCHRCHPRPLNQPPPSSVPSPSPRPSSLIQPSFGYSRKDVLLIGGGIFGAGYAAYYGLQAGGMDAGRAGNYVQAAVFSALTFGWVGSYLWRVGTKNMTYARQLEAYEEAVMAKRLEEMPEAERARLVAEAEAERAARGGGGGGGGASSGPPPSGG